MKILIQLTSFILIGISATSQGGFYSINALSIPIGLVCKIDQNSELQIKQNEDHSYIARIVSHTKNQTLVQNLTEKTHCQAKLFEDETVYENNCFSATDSIDSIYTIPVRDKIFINLSSNLIEGGQKWYRFEKAQCKIILNENILP